MTWSEQIQKLGLDDVCIIIWQLSTWLLYLLYERYSRAAGPKTTMNDLNVDAN